MLFRGAEGHTWAPVPPSRYVERHLDRPNGTIPREAARAPARYVTRVPEQLQDLLDTLRIREWEIIKGMVEQAAVGDT